MELAIGISFNGNSFEGQSVTPSGELRPLPLQDLHKYGVPTTSKSTRRRIDSNFADWREVDPAEYLSAFGYSRSDAATVNPQFFEAEIDGRRFVVPALVLMRALFRPAKHLLPAMFRPQALDQIGRIKSSDSGLEVEIDASWRKAAGCSQAPGWNSAVSWLFAHPSAFLTAGSVHSNALSGRIALTLPNAEARIVFSGLAVKKTMFVTDGSVMNITPLDAAIFDLAGLPKTFQLHQSALGKPERITKITVPFHCDGTSALSDSEWGKVENIILNSRQKANQYKLSQRDLFDGVLDKLATNRGWQEIDYKVGTWVNASALFQRLLKRGVLPEILGFLGESRTSSR